MIDGEPPRPRTYRVADVPAVRVLVAEPGPGLLRHGDRVRDQAGAARAGRAVRRARSSGRSLLVSGTVTDAARAGGRRRGGARLGRGRTGARVGRRVRCVREHRRPVLGRAHGDPGCRPARARRRLRARLPAAPRGADRRPARDGRAWRDSGGARRLARGAGPPARGGGYRYLDLLTAIDRLDHVEVLAHVVDPDTLERAQVATLVPDDDLRLASIVDRVPRRGLARAGDCRDVRHRSSTVTPTRGRSSCGPAAGPAPLRKATALAARVETPWPGAAEPDEGRRARRPQLPPGVRASWLPEGTP